MGCGGPGFASQRVTAIIVAQKGDRWCFKTSEQRRCARPPRYHQPSPRIVCHINPARKQAVASTTSTMDPQRVEQEKEENAQEVRRPEASAVNIIIFPCFCSYIVAVNCCSSIKHAGSLPCRQNATCQVLCIMCIWCIWWTDVIRPPSSSNVVFPAKLAAA